MMSIIGNIFLVMFLWGIVNFVMYMVKIRQIIRKNKDNPNVQGVKIENGKVHLIEKDKDIFEAKIKEEVKDLVIDPVCHAEIEKSKAHHLIKNESSYYFCSWDCREKFLEPVDEKHL